VQAVVLVLLDRGDDLAHAREHFRLVLLIDVPLEEAKHVADSAAIA
jgi:hypothetical protein